MGGCGEGSVRPGVDTMRPWEFAFAITKENWERSGSAAMLQTLTKALSEAAAWIGKPVGDREPTFELFAFCKNLPDVIFLCLDDADMANSDEIRALVFEVLCTLVEFTVAFLSREEELYSAALVHTLEALSFALDSDMQYYSQKRNNGEILVLPSRLEFALRVPGCVVRVFDDDKKHYFCSQKGVSNHASCECCSLPSEVDAALVSVYWQLGNGYEFFLKVLRGERILGALERTSLQVMALVMRPLGQVLIDHGSWIERLEESFADGEMMRSCCLAFGDVFQSLKKALVDKRDGVTPFDNIFYSRKSFLRILLYLDAVQRWSLACERGVSWGDDPGELLILFLDRIGGSKGDYLVCGVLREFLDCAQGLRYEVPFVRNILQWLKEGEVILRFLTLNCCFEVTELVEFAGKHGLIMKEEVFLGIINHDRVDSDDRPLDERHAHARVVATILKNFKLDTYKTKTKASVYKWLKRWQATDSVIRSRLVCCILEKLVECDKNRKLRSRLLNLLWKHASDLPATDFVSCLTKIACHYTSIAEPKIMIHPGEETEKFLQACSTADKECSVACLVGSKFVDKAVIEQRVKMYQDMEVNFYFKTSLELQHVLDINIPLSAHETSNECLKRLGLAQELISGLKTTTRNNMVSVMSSAMAPELRTLEAIKEEIALRRELCQRMQDAQERHLQEYDALKEDQYNSLKKFFQDCFREKERIVRDAMYAKAEVLAAVEMAKLPSKRESSPDFIRKRMLQEVENIFEEAEERHRKALEKQPNLECNVCFVSFSGKRKRACFDPCGHAGTCMDCGMREWKRRKACPLCKCHTMKPLAVPSTLFF